MPLAALLGALHVAALGALAWWAPPLGGALPWVLAAAVAGTALALAVPALAWRQHRRDEAAQRRQREALDAMQSAVLLWDAQGQLVFVNRDFLQVYAAVAPLMQPGVQFEEALRATVAAGMVPEARDDPEGWLQRRIAFRQNPEGPLLRQMPDGRWRRIVEQRLSDGSVLAHSVDVTELVEARNALALAQQEAERARQRLEDAVEALPAGFELYDAEDRLVMVNRNARQLYPQLSDLVSQRPTFEEVVRANRARGGLPEFSSDEAFETWLARRMAERRHPSVPQLRQMEDQRWLRVHESRTREGGLVGVRIDVTEVMEGRQAAERATQRLQEAIEALPEAFALYDAHDELVTCNQRYRDDYPSAVALIQPGMNFEDMLRHCLAHGQFPQAVGREEAWLAERMQAHRNPSGPVLVELPGNRWLRIDERRTRDGGVAGVRTDVTELVHREQALRALNQRLDELNAELSRLSETDALTGLANRRHFDRRLADEVSRASRHGGSLALLMLDVDHFKRYNDRHGHPAGDACLARVAEVLRATARRPSDLVARFGGEEFAVLLPQHTPAEALALAERCVAALDAAALPHGDSPVAPHVTLSIGAAHVQAPGSDFKPAELLRRADAALYLAKQAGRHRVVVH